MRHQSGQPMTDMSDQPLFHLSPRELYDVFEAGVVRGQEEAGLWQGIRKPAHRSRKQALIDLMYTHAMYLRYQKNDPIHDRVELHNAIEAMFEGVE